MPLPSTRGHPRWRSAALVLALSTGASGLTAQSSAEHDARARDVARIRAVEHPEMLVYERLPTGDYRFNGVEYIVPFAVWPSSDDPPVVMGVELKPAPSLELWYRHVWVWLENPSGLFADWNPRVRC